jgi:hypothetical protein
MARSGYTADMEQLALVLFICGAGSLGIATYLMTQADRSGSTK